MQCTLPIPTVLGCEPDHWKGGGVEGDSAGGHLHAILSLDATKSKKITQFIHTCTFKEGLVFTSLIVMFITLLKKFKW